MPVTTEQAPAPHVVAAKRRPAPELVVSWFYGPLADPVARALVPLRVPPPAVVLANAVVGLAAAGFAWQGEPVTAAVVLQLKTLLDNADGRLARLSRRTSLLGRYLDTEVDFVVNAALFAAIGATTGEPLLALAAFGALSSLLSVSFTAVPLYREARGGVTRDPPASGGALERALAWVYSVVFAPQDRLLRRLLERRLARVLDAVADPETRRGATLEYHDRVTMAILANLGLSTQLAALGICLAVGATEAYLWGVVGVAALLPLLQLRRERLARSQVEVSGRRAA
jgi:archaetidylinositol phosphate synthase